MTIKKSVIDNSMHRSDKDNANVLGVGDLVSTPRNNKATSTLGRYGPSGGSIMNIRPTSDHEVIRVEHSTKLMVPRLNTADQEDAYGEDEYWYNLMLPSWFQCGQKTAVGPEFYNVPAKRRRRGNDCAPRSDAIDVGRFKFYPIEGNERR
mmetsp:Transcript_16818/g.21269  ORF Transcript_16818/g.21269 Transcript_16818/m.21269 type:complete len:150 (-) Transcript_16818:215-664(-)|eukprot:CAMPEP_0203653718 /NCGR_PEP_ID=MMETSP0088-20131115/33449_1 /ASSEMBLY_ACC=CAM_ASM_001087 /TAXON_ID=426623 /ORGANISM="Chaetoceros affinis, Strain CCMP159" /LENGTH=149 /DNA_ID=CAMNT_0050513753 /DNA_START=59 /DNA_END=508 /DNA_ORIENTATION=-